MKYPFFSLLVAALWGAPLLAQQPRAIQQAAQDDQSDRPTIDVEAYSIEVTLAPPEHRLTGRADIKFKQLDRKTYTTFDLDRRLRVDRASIGGADVRFRQFDVDSTVEIDLSNQQFNSNPVLHIEYSGILDPEQSRREPVLARVSEDSAFLLYEGKWFPINGLYRDKADMRLKLNVPPEWTLVTDVPKAGDGFASNQPSYWGTVAAGKYTTTSYKSEKAEIAVHSVKADADIVKSMAESVGKVFDYYSQRFGPPPSSNFRVVEVEGANWNAQWSIGMLLLPASQLRKDFDLPALAAAVAHQWFPLKIGVKDPTPGSSMVWPNSPVFCTSSKRCHLPRRKNILRRRSSRRWRTKARHPSARRVVWIKIHPTTARWLNIKGLSF